MKEKIEIVCGILKMEEGYLIARRGKGVHENIWEFPGGKVESDESKAQAIEREMLEELELKVKAKACIKQIVDERETCLLHVSAFLCEYIAGEVKLHVHHEVRYESIDQLKNYTFEKADKPILEALMKIKKHKDGTLL